MAQAKRLCPEAIIISGNLSGYVYTSAKLQMIFGNYSPIVEPFSVDEAFLDITGCHRIFGTVENLVMKMKEDIKKELSLTCSIGISPNKLLAKMASGENKPDGMTIMDKEDFIKMFYHRQVDALWGVGEASKKALNKKGIYTVGDMAARDEKELQRYFGQNGLALSENSRGDDPSEVYSIDTLPLEKSMSHETTLEVDLSEIDKIYSTLLWLSDKVARRLRKDNFCGRTISVKIRSSDFKTITRDKTLKYPTDQCRIIFETAKKLMPKEYGPNIKVRLLGVRVSHLEKNMDNPQLFLINNQELESMSKCSKAMDEIRDKFGESVIKLAGAQI